MPIENIMEKIVWDNMETVMDHKPGMCRCEICKSDIAAYALNKLKPHYVATVKGSAITRAQFMENQYYLDLIIVLTEAVEKVSANPRHNSESI
ncbi:MAG: late competence development ComFB family protein [Syntrophomonadaceae bacterium]|nr:late competence development ComFB family protein [Syntrophomonadaceae bacterium]